MIKYWLLLFTAALPCLSIAQKTENIIIVTTDGFRWQEVFKGMDSSIAADKKFNQGDSSYLFTNYWNNDISARRKKLMPFLWNTIASNGQLYGNRLYNNKVDNANPYKFSYPGYNEIFTGYADTLVNSNEYPPNPNINVLEFLHTQPAFKNKIAAFGAWDAFDRILNEKRSGFPVISAFDTCGSISPNNNEKLINRMLKNSYKPFGEEECLDVFTHYAAMEYLQTKKPKVLYIAYGETDEWAHSGHYKDYLNAARQVDSWLSDIWQYVQSDAQYAGKTTLLITTDHGRGDHIKSQWTSHGQAIDDAHEIWFAVIGPDTKPLGEIKNNMRLYQQQFAQTIATFLGYHFTSNHPVADGITTVH